MKSAGELIHHVKRSHCREKTSATPVGPIFGFIQMRIGILKQASLASADG